MSLEELFNFTDNDFIDDTPPLLNKMKKMPINEVKFINYLNEIQDSIQRVDLEFAL